MKSYARQAKRDWKALKKYDRPNRTFRTRVRNVVTQLAERKYSAQYLQAEFPSIGNAWVERDFSNITSGDDIFGERQGRRIAVTDFFLYGILQTGAVNTEFDDAYNKIRIVCTFAAGTTPMTTAGATINDIIGKRMDGYQVQKKFIDKYIALPPVGRDSTGYLPCVKVVKLYKKFKKPIIIDYSQDNGTTPSVRPIVSMISDSAAIPSPGFTVGHVAFMYKDI